MAKYTIEIKDNTIINITPITKSMEIETAKKILEDYVGDHIAVIGKGETLSANQKRELRKWADKLAPIEDEECQCYKKGFTEGYVQATSEVLSTLDDECECNGQCDECCECECHEKDKLTWAILRALGLIED